MNREHHITPELIGKYRAKTLAPTELVSVTRHLAICDTCRRQAVRGAESARLAGALGPRHLTFEQLETLVRQPALAHGEDLEHITFCGVCASELADLRVFRDTLGLKTTERKPSFVRFLLPAGAFAIAILTFVGLQLNKSPESPRTTRPESSLTSIVLDRNEKLGLDAAGRLHGLETFPTAEREIIAEALRAGTLPPQRDLREVLRGRETQLGGEATPVALLPAGPVGTVVPSDHPVFRWKAPAGASAFRIAVFDTDFNPVAESGNVTGTEWQPANALVRGTIYVWTVSATIAGKTVTSPKAPEPEARFQVASLADAEAVETLAKASDLASALGAWQRGMREEALTTIERLQGQNQQSKELQKLRATMSGSR